MTLKDVFVRWVLMRGLAMGTLFFCIEHFIFIPQASVARVALSSLVMPGVYLALGLARYAKGSRNTLGRSRSSGVERA